MYIIYFKGDSMQLTVKQFGILVECFITKLFPSKI